LIGGPIEDGQRQRQRQRLEELIEQLALALNLVRPGGNALTAGLDALKTFALDRHFLCAHTLDLADHPVRVDRIGEVLEAWCRHLITRSVVANASPSLKSRGSVSDEEIPARRLERERVVLPLLEERDWTPTQWAMKAGVGPAVALDYLSGKTKKLQKTKRQLLAKALGISERLLPD
jgi:hypothetical protein